MASQPAVLTQSQDRSHYQSQCELDFAPSTAVRSTLGGVELAALEGKLQLLQIQRELSAVRCQGFIEMIQSTLRAEHDDDAIDAARPAKSGAEPAGSAGASPGGGCATNIPRLGRSSVEPLDRARRDSRRQLFRHMSLEVHPTAVSQSWRDDLSFYDEPSSCSPRVPGHGGSGFHASPSRRPRGSPRNRSPRHRSARAPVESTSPQILHPTAGFLSGSPRVTAPGVRQLPLTPRTCSASPRTCAASPRIVALANSSLRRHVSLNAGFESPCG